MKKYDQQEIELFREVLNSEINVLNFNSQSSNLYSHENYHLFWLVNKGVYNPFIPSHQESIYRLIILQPGGNVNISDEQWDSSSWIISISPTTFLNLCIDTYHINQLLTYHSPDPLLMIDIDHENGRRISSLIELTAEILKRDPEDGEAAAVSLLKTLFIWCKNKKTNQEKEDQSPGHHTALVRSFRRLVSKNYPEHHHVAFYAGLLNVSPRYLNRVVKQTTGMTAKSVILEQLLNQACHDLKLSDLTVKEIAIKLGFSEPEHFSNFFKKKAGCSPTQYRDN